jgi:hypothetical protein
LNLAPFELLLFTEDPAVIRSCCRASEIRGIVVDWENQGKHERQSGFDTQINDLTAEDLRAAKLATPPGTSVVCRINGWHDSTGLEIEAAIANGADEILLPMVRRPFEVQETLRIVDQRARVGILIETRSGAECARELSELPLSRIYVGLNDLAIDFGNDSLFDALCDGTVDRIRQAIPEHVAFGIAGLTLPECGEPIPSKMLACEIARLRASFTFLRRSFLRDIKGRDPRIEATRMVATVGTARARDEAQVRADHAEFRDAVYSSAKVLQWRAGVR